jgi:hypothetical protein
MASNSARRVGPGQSSERMSGHAAPGPHVLGVQAEGIAGGCNVGYVGAWSGNVHIAV